MFILNRKAIVQRSIKENCIADFTMKIVYVAAWKQKK